MRFLNKIIFINSASVPYAEIELDGNVHLIGTQGVGKSTLLRAILFFYTANKSKLGIPTEKQGFDNYYFEFQNSYIIYEIIRDGIASCVLAYKVNGKVAFRFFNSEYKQSLFIDSDNIAFLNWDKIRAALGKEIYYTPIIKSYEEYRRIIYGDNKGLKPEFRKYAIVESTQYQNIPRTVQNVLLNTTLEAKFIKETIINSLGDEEFFIDIENYATAHLSEFETQINDIKQWSKKNRKGQIAIRKQADRILEKSRYFNFLNKEKKMLAYNLAARVDYIENQKPVELSAFAKADSELKTHYKKIENLQKTHRRRELDVASDFKNVKTKIADAKEKQKVYREKGIQEIIKKIEKKGALLSKLSTLDEEKTLLTSKFTQIAEKYKALINQVSNRQVAYENTQNTAKNALITTFSEEKATLIEIYKQLVKDIVDAHKEEKDKGYNTLDNIKEEVNKLLQDKSELKYKVFFASEIEKLKKSDEALRDAISTSKNFITNAQNEITTTRATWELKQNEVENASAKLLEKEKLKSHNLTVEIEKIERKIAQSKSSFYGWLNDKLPNWQDTIGKVIDEDSVLFNTDLDPKLTGKFVTTFYGIDINLNALEKRVKTVKEYREEIKDIKDEINIIKEVIKDLDEELKIKLDQLKKKFITKINELKEVVSENEYLQTQNEHKLKQNGIQLTELKTKSKKEKEAVLQLLEENLEATVAKKIIAEESLENLKKAIKRKSRLKENERDAKVKDLSTVKDEKLSSIVKDIANQKIEAQKRVDELNLKLSTELGNKGADTKRLNQIENQLIKINDDLTFISNNEAIVIEYYKDKRELFDTVPKLKVDRDRLALHQETIIKDHKKELEKVQMKYRIQGQVVQSIKDRLEEFKTDEEALNEFKKSNTFIDIQTYFNDPEITTEAPKTISTITLDLNNKYYKGIETFKELQQATNAFTGNFNENNIFKFKTRLNEDVDFLNFASDLKDFIEADKIDEFEKRVNERFANIIQLIGRETKELNSKKEKIEKIINKINNDFRGKNFIEAIKGMEMKTLESSNSIVKLLNEIKEFNDENTLTLGEANLFTSSESNLKNQKAVDLLKQLVKELMRSKDDKLTLSESFDLQFRIVENNNDSGWVEKIKNVGSNGTDILVKAMINISLLNVFKKDASKKFKDFKLHCMMDEIGTLHPTNQKGILRFANERNILLINGSPTSQNATDYKYTYKLAKEKSQNNDKRYITRVNRLIKKISK